MRPGIVRRGIGWREMVRRQAARFCRVLALVLAPLLVVLASPSAAVAQHGGPAPGVFDFYVLSLSWSPTYCEARGNGARNEPQCQLARPYAFVVHGLWPQNLRGYPQDCLYPAPYVPNETVSGMLDIMPSKRLVIHEWRKHGTCSGLAPAAYFALVRQAREKIAIPQQFARLDNYQMVAPAELEAAFRAANPGLAADMMSVDCDKRRLREVRICLSRDLAFQSCPEVDRRACRLDKVVMPPVRGGN